MKQIGRYTVADSDLIPLPQQDMAAGKPLTDIQWLAERTYGFVTPANAVTFAGIGFVAGGCWLFQREHRKTGAAVAIAGLMCDLADGTVARQTRTGNYLVGRHLDAVSDGVKAAMIAVVLNRNKIYSVPEIGVNYLPKLAGWLANFASRFLLGNDPKTSADGKITEFIRWLSPGLALGSYMFRQLRQRKVARWLRLSGWIVTAVSGYLGLRSAVGYWRAAIADTRAARAERWRQLLGNDDDN